MTAKAMTGCLSLNNGMATWCMCQLATVENLAPCVKMAFDKYVPANLARYALSWQYVTSQVFRAPDYM